MTTIITLPVSAEKILSTTPPNTSSSKTDWLARVAELAPNFKGRAAAYDEADHFVGDNYRDLKAARLFSAGVPSSLGGGGASYARLCDLIRILAHSCGSTALAFAMHSHQIAAMVWRWRQLDAPMDAFLERVAREELVLVSSGGSDWLQSSGKAEAVEGGYRVTARKTFASGCLAGDMLLTSAVAEDPQAGPTVLHFSIPLSAPQVKIIPCWRALGMRGTGSNDISIEGAFVPQTAITLRRPRGKWHPAMHLSAKTALPMIYAAYLGLAESAREIALRAARHARLRSDSQLVAGEMENELFTACLAHARMVEAGAQAQPGPECTNAVLMGRTVVAQAAIRAVEKAMELAGGRAFHRDLGLERVYRDVQAARFHALPEKAQQQITGRLAFGLELDPDHEARKAATSQAA